MTNEETQVAAVEQDPCVAGVCGHSAQAHDEDGCGQCTCSGYITDGARS